MNIGVYGGAFNPIHLGHLILAQNAALEYSLDFVLFVVSLNPPHKSADNMVSFEHRYRMTELALGDSDKFRVSDIEKQVSGKSYTYFVLQKIKEFYGEDNNYFLIIGEDEANYFHKWYRYEQIMEMCRVLVGNRNNELPENSLKFESIKTPLIEISSSDIRERVALGKPVFYLTEKSVVRYIFENKLYMTE